MADEKLRTSWNEQANSLIKGRRTPHCISNPWIVSHSYSLETIPNQLKDCIQVLCIYFCQLFPFSLLYQVTQCLQTSQKVRLYLVIPEGGEDKIHFNKYASKWQQSSHQGNYRWCQIPLLLGNRPRYGLDTAWIVWSATPVSPKNSTKKSQGEGNEGPDDKDNYHCTKGNGC